MMLDYAGGDEPEVHVGTILCERYRAEHLIGRTETGLIVAATDMLRGGKVAIKMLDPSIGDSEVLVARLKREAHLLAQLTSPHVVRVFEVATHADPVSRTDAVCMVMELLEGVNLGQLLRKRGPLPIDEAVGLIIQACDGLADAHSLGIVHRDIKPQNLFLASRPDGGSILKVLDFGVGKQQGASMGLTATGAAIGSPLYTALEQFKNASQVDARADIWSLGLVLYFLLCKKNAFDGDNLMLLMMKIASQPPAPLRERRPEVPVDLEAVILQCVEKDPAMRFQNVAALARALMPFAPAWAQSYIPAIEARTSRRSLPSLPLLSHAPPAAQEARQSQPEGARQSQPEGARQSQPQGVQQSRPRGPAMSQPSQDELRRAALRSWILVGVLAVVTMALTFLIVRAFAG